jgi:hypothetical protein
MLAADSKKRTLILALSVKVRGCPSRNGAKAPRSAASCNWLSVKRSLKASKQGPPHKFINVLSNAQFREARKSVRARCCFVTNDDVGVGYVVVCIKQRCAARAVDNRLFSRHLVRYLQIYSIPHIYRRCTHRLMQNFRLHSFMYLSCHGQASGKTRNAENFYM